MNERVTRIVAALRNILDGCSVSSDLLTPIESFEAILRTDAIWQDIAFGDACAELWECIFEEDFTGHADIAARIRDVLKV